jgi:pyridoxamine 5'-phosphate oxidase
MSRLAELRREYALARLDVTDVSPDPLVQLDRWLHEALKADVPEPTAMTVATVSAGGQPSARIVLLKGADARGLVFYTNYHSAKGEQIAGNARVALLFHWAELERQVRVEGLAEKTPAAESDAYFASRPLGSRLGALASPQSAVVGSREALEARFEQVRKAHGEDVARPAHWGGYRVVPTRLEFWQGRPNRLHDRIAYTRADGRWTIERLAP